MYAFFALSNVSSQGYGFSCGHVWMWELNCEEGWAPKKWCFQIVVLEKALENPLDSKEIKPVNPKGNQPWMFTGRTDAEAKAPILWLPDMNSWKRPWCWERLKAGGERDRTIEDAMVGWHHRLDEHESEQAQGVGDAIQPSHPLSTHSPPALNLSQNQGLFQWVSCSHLVAKVLELQFQRQSFQWTFRVDFL